MTKKKKTLIGIDRQVLDKDLKPIRVAHDFIDNKPYIGVILPTIKKKIYDDGTEEKDSLPSLDFFLLTVNGKGYEVLHYDDEIIKEKYIIRREPMILPAYVRFSVEYLKNKLKCDGSEITKINITDIFKKLKNIIFYYIEFSHDVYYIITALWILGTYFMPVFFTYPYIHLTGSKGSGKTKFLDLCYSLCFNAIKSVNMSGASMFRALESLGATFLIDEKENIGNKETSSEKIQDLREILLTGYKKGSYVLRIEDVKSNKLAAFEVYGPKVIAHITGVDDVLEDRCIKIVMLKSLGPQSNRVFLIPKQLEVFDNLRYDMYKAYLDYAQELSNIYTTMVLSNEFPELVGRERELWLPILALARLVDPDGTLGLIRGLLSYIDTLKADVKDEEIYSYEHILLNVLSYIRELNGKDGDGYYLFNDIHERFLSALESEMNIKFVGPRKTADILEKLGFTKKKRDSKTKKVQYYISREMIEKAESRLYNRPLQNKLDSVTEGKISKKLDIQKHEEGMLKTIADTLIGDVGAFTFDIFYEQVKQCMNKDENTIKEWLELMVEQKKYGKEVVNGEEYYTSIN